MQDLHKWKEVSPIIALVGVLVMFFPLYAYIGIFNYAVQSHKFNWNEWIVITTILHNSIGDLT